MLLYENEKVTCKSFSWKYGIITFHLRNPWWRRIKCSGFNENQCKVTTPRYDGGRGVWGFQTFMHWIVRYLFIKVYLCNFQENIYNNFFKTSVGFHFRYGNDCWINPSTHATICILRYHCIYHLYIIGNYTIGRNVKCIMCGFFFYFTQ